MRKILLFVAAVVASLAASAQSIGVFNHLGAGVGVGTNGVSVEVASPITSFVQMRAGVSVMPGITFNSSADFTTPTGNGTVDLKGDFKRVQGQVIFNVYPIPFRSFYVAAGAYFGGDKLLKISGHSDELAAAGAQAVIGDYKIPADANGNIEGGFKTSGFRPYLGIGFGRVVPGHLVSFSMDLGVQFQKKPELYTLHGSIDKSMTEDDNTFNKIANALKVYPTLTFKLNFRAF